MTQENQNPKPDEVSEEKHMKSLVIYSAIIIGIVVACFVIFLTI